MVLHDQDTPSVDSDGGDSANHVTRVGLHGQRLHALPDGMETTFAAEALSLVEVQNDRSDKGIHVLVAWLSDTGRETLEALRRWQASHCPGAALLGYAPVGDQSVAEAALEVGFDDIMVRGSIRELACRAKALHRRFSRTRRQGGVLRVGPLRLDSDQSTIYVGSDRHVLTRIETRLMAALMRARGNALSRDALLSAAWGDEALETSERAVDNSVLRLRRKLGEANLIATVRGFGFRLELG